MRNKYHLDSSELSDLINEETEFLPLMSDEDEAKISKEDTPDALPILPLRNTVLFPGVIIPITIGSCLLYTSPSPRDGLLSRMPSSA